MLDITSNSNKFLSSICRFSMEAKKQLRGFADIRDSDVFSIFTELAFFNLFLPTPFLADGLVHPVLLCRVLCLFEPDERADTPRKKRGSQPLAQETQLRNSETPFKKSQ